MFSVLKTIYFDNNDYSSVEIKSLTHRRNTYVFLIELANLFPFGHFKTLQNIAKHCTLRISGSFRWIAGLT
jgi:hypothetical protein